MHHGRCAPTKGVLRLGRGCGCQHAEQVRFSWRAGAVVGFWPRACLAQATSPTGQAAAALRACPWARLLARTASEPKYLKTTKRAHPPPIAPAHVRAAVQPRPERWPAARRALAASAVARVRAGPPHPSRPPQRRGAVPEPWARSGPRPATLQPQICPTRAALLPGVWRFPPKYLLVCTNLIF